MQLDSVFIGLAIAGAAIAMWGIQQTSTGSSPAAKLAAFIAAEPDKLGWMDDGPFTDADRQRVAEISGRGRPDSVSVIRSMQGGARSQIIRRDFELMRQDWRRARAAYPDVSEDDLGYGAWIQVDYSAKIPAKWGGANSNSMSEKDSSESYLDGPDYRSFVKPEYTRRADAATTKRVLSEMRDGERQKWIKRISKWGYSTSWGSTGGSGRFECYPDPLPSSEEPDDLHIPGKCVVILDDTKYVFPFVPSEWIDPPWYDGVKKLASFRQATSEPYKPVQKPWIMKDGLLARGEKCPPGRLCRSMWNGDGYDNNDIGPADPVSWVLESPFGLAFIPAPDNGEQHSAPEKPWWIIASYYGSTPQASGGWTEAEAKAMLPKLQTGFTIGMQGQDSASLNLGNLREARATQVPPRDSILVLAEKAMPVAPPKGPEPASCVQGGTLMPGESCSVGGRF